MYLLNCAKKFVGIGSKMLGKACNIYSWHWKEMSHEGRASRQSITGLIRKSMAEARAPRKCSPELCLSQASRCRTTVSLHGRRLLMTVFILQKIMGRPLGDWVNNTSLKPIQLLNNLKEWVNANLISLRHSKELILCHFTNSFLLSYLISRIENTYPDL